MGSRNLVYMKEPDPGRKDCTYSTNERRDSFIGSDNDSEDQEKTEGSASVRGTKRKRMKSGTEKGKVHK